MTQPISASSVVTVLFDHCFWADDLVLAALTTASLDRGEPVREFAHVLGAESVWLARLAAATPILPVWPNLARAELVVPMQAVRTGYRSLLTTLDDAGLQRECAYTNTAGKRFTSAVGDILHHVTLHGQYHRGKVNQLLRAAGLEPAPCDYIAWARGAPAARS